MKRISIEKAAKRVIKRERGDGYLEQRKEPGAGIISIQMLGYVGEIVGSKEISVEFHDGDNIASLMGKLLAQWPERAIKIFFNQRTGVLRECVLVINDRVVIMPEELEQTLKTGDKVMVLPVLSGG
ncbi:MAG: MoaD/ThiS family protein [Bacillota bacterium]